MPTRASITSAIVHCFCIISSHSYAPSRRTIGPFSTSNNQITATQLKSSNIVNEVTTSSLPNTIPSPNELQPIKINESIIESSKPSTLSPAAQWHKNRRRQMLQKYASQILPLERDSSSNTLALSLLSLSNVALLSLAIVCGTAQLSLGQVALLALFPGSMFSLWTLQILHDCLHGSLLQKGQQKFLFGTMKRKQLQDAILFWGSMPSVFGYYLYLKYGHLTHHKSLGDPQAASLKQLFDSSQKDFEDGDVLFVAHRMKLKGEVGPKFNIGGKEITMSISKTGFNNWKVGKPLRNALVFATSFMYERFMLMINDVVVAMTGRNYFFPNKPKEFHDECAKYCRCAVLVRGLLWKLAGWKSLLFLYLSETLWSIPPHPASAMFVTNHGSTIDENDGGACIPSSSTYAGRWYSLFTLGTNYHCEHHDFPTIPLHRLGELRKIAPEFYKEGSDDNVFRIMKKAFAKPEFYACMNAGIVQNT